MGKGLIITIIVFLILGGVGVYLYFKYERNIEIVDLVSLSIFAIETDTELMNKTGYEIFVDNIFYAKGNTSKHSAVLHRVPFNSSIRVNNENLDNQTYYIDTQSFVSDENKTYRVTLDLTTFKEFDIKQDGIFGEDELIKLTLNSTINTKNMYFCIDYSVHIIFVNIQDFTRTQEKCYVMNELDANENFNITLEYTYFGQLDDDDYLKISFFDVNDKNVQVYQIK